MRDHDALAPAAERAEEAGKASRPPRKHKLVARQKQLETALSLMLPALRSRPEASTAVHADVLLERRVRRQPVLKQIERRIGHKEAGLALALRSPLEEPNHNVQHLSSDLRALSLALEA
jgi:hypothetical protein